MEQEIKIEEIKVKVAQRVPPGDRWSPLDNDTVVLESLTDVLQYVYEKQNVTQFFMDAREGFVYIIKTEETVVIPPPPPEPEPPKTFSLYGED